MMAVWMFLPGLSFATDQIQHIIVSADALTKEEAVNRALQKATEQAYNVLTLSSHKATNAKTPKSQTISFASVTSYTDLYSEQLPKK